MSKLIIHGKKPLCGEVSISGAKNAVLPILAATLLTKNSVTLYNVPRLSDVNTMILLLKQMGAECIITEDKHCLTVEINAKTLKNYNVPYELMRPMRASILALAPLLAGWGHAEVSAPGGCAIGSRPIELHLDGLKAMGAHIVLKEGNLYATAPDNGLQGATIYFPRVTVTGTENLMMAATLATGQTILQNAAREPEIIDLANFLNQLGANIQGQGSSTIIIEGVKKLSATHCHYTIMPDRIEAGTYLAAAIVTQGEITLKNIDSASMSTILEKIMQAGAECLIDSNTVKITMHRRPSPVDIETAPYPGFPTDMQAQFMVINSVAAGHSTIIENVFENRFMHVPELIRLGANIKLHGRIALCEGVENLTGAPVLATDLRASASLVLAGLAASGETVIDAIHHIDRGYADIEKHLIQLGAKIQRIDLTHAEDGSQ